jgi:hypothetical protein
MSLSLLEGISYKSNNSIKIKKKKISYILRLSRQFSKRIPEIPDLLFVILEENKKRHSM